ncbi:ATP synthase regulation protein NCA2-domain-containing protein [Limtongia smithiae]|uniref:ATP synthase regulation protein NCA2-domain-containing protein n=1 Tax=Limtongia smithiae TaxID=1125753 RepID=UPI0034CFC5A6
MVARTGRFCGSETIWMSSGTRIKCVGIFSLQTGDDQRRSAYNNQPHPTATSSSISISKFSPTTTRPRMSTVVDDRVRALSAQLELLASTTLPRLLAPTLSLPKQSASIRPDEGIVAVDTVEPLLAVLNSLLIRPGYATPSLPFLHAQLTAYLHISSDATAAAAKQNQSESDEDDDEWGADAYEDSVTDCAKQLEWFVVAAACVVLYGHVTDTLLGQTLPLADDIYYWDNVLHASTGLLLYSVQTAPAACLAAVKDIYSDARSRLLIVRARPSLRDWINTLRASFSRHRLRIRHAAVLNRIATLSSSASTSIFCRTALSRLLVSPLSAKYKEVQTKQHRLRLLRDLQAAALGVLVGESIMLENGADWRRGVERAVGLMQTITQSIILDESDSNHDDDATSVDEFERKVFAAAATPTHHQPPYMLALKILHISDTVLPRHASTLSHVASSAAKPGVVTRYWPAAVLGLAFGGTVMRVLFSRRASIAQWCADAVDTAIGFWRNWVVGPVRNIIATIRHDDNAQVAIVGRKSLEADMESLERMVVDFALDTTPIVAGVPAPYTLSTTEIDAIRTGVREGDLSAVLKVYERELKSPLKNALRGELVRTLLIQVQKTKVDVEVAITGIDRLLKSQELVFGTVAALPSSVFVWFTASWGARMYSGKGLRGQSEVKQRVVRTLGNVERMLTVRHGGSSSSSASGGSSSLHSGAGAGSPSGEWLSYTDHGLMLCELHVLRNSLSIFPRELRDDWTRDLADLEDLKLGTARQRYTIERIWRVYSKYFR